MADEKDRIKQAASGRWVEIARTLGVPMREMRGPDSRDEYWFISPLRDDDTSPTNFSLNNTTGKYNDLAKVMDRGDGLALIQKVLRITFPETLQLVGEQVGITPNQDGVTLNPYSKCKKFESDVLDEFNLSNSGNSILMPYMDVSGEVVAVRRRIQLYGKDRFRWQQGTTAKELIYGLHLVHHYKNASSPVTTLFVAEGESNMHAARHHFVPMLTVPGTEMVIGNYALANAVMANLPDIDLVIILEDPGAEQFCEIIHDQFMDQSFQGEVLKVSPKQVLGVKDICDLHVKHDGNPTAFNSDMEILAKSAVEVHDIEQEIPLSEYLESSNDPHRLAAIYKRLYKNEVWHKGMMHRWNGNHYKPTPEDVIMSDIGRCCREEAIRVAEEQYEEWKKADEAKRGKCPQVFKTGKTTRVNVHAALVDYACIDQETEPPFWIAGHNPGWEDPKKIISFPNKMVNLDLLSDKKSNAAFRPTPRLFSTSCLEFDFDPVPKPPINWLNFLDSVFPNDPESISTLQEWFGYCWEERNPLHKIVALIGPARCGKGVIADTLRAMVGPRKHTELSLARLADKNGLANLIGKSVAVISETKADYGANVNLGLAVENLLVISGGGEPEVDGKWMVPVSMALPVRLMLTANGLPKLADASNALASRIVYLQIRKSWVGKEDTDLRSKLKTEHSAIFWWALEGYKRISERKAFIQPQSSAHLNTSMREMSSPVETFISETCILGAEEKMSKDDLFESWRNWCEKVGINYPGQRPTFLRNVTMAFPEIVEFRCSQYRGLKGIRLATVLDTPIQ